MSGDPFDGWSRELLIKALISAEDSGAKQVASTIRLAQHADRTIAKLWKVAGPLLSANAKRKAEADRVTAQWQRWRDEEGLSGAQVAVRAKVAEETVYRRTRQRKP